MLTIEPLSGSHVRTAFSCGVPELDRYFHELVSQDIKRRASNCFMALGEAGTVRDYGATLPAAECSRQRARPDCRSGRVGVQTVSGA